MVYQRSDTDISQPWCDLYETIRSVFGTASLTNDWDEHFPPTNKSELFEPAGANLLIFE